MTSDASTCTLTGFVRNQGLPLAGIEVRVYRSGRSRDSFLAVAGDLLATGNTDSRGRFEFAVGSGEYRLDVVPPSSTRFLNQSLEVQVDDDFSGCRVNLSTGLIVNGAVRTTDGVPAASGQLNFIGVDSTDYRARANLNADGTFTITLPRGTYQVGLRGYPATDEDAAPEMNRSESFASGRIKLLLIQSDEEKDFVLSEFVTLRGEVSCPAGSPVANAKVELKPRVPDNLIAKELGLGALCFTNENGRFGVQAEPGEYELLIEPPEGSSFFGVREQLNLTETVIKKVSLAEGFRLRGKVVYGDDILSNCLVRAYNIDKDVEAIGLTDEQGQFTLNVASGSYKLLVTAHPKDTPTVTIDGSEFSGLAPWVRVVKVGRDTRVDIRLQQGTAVHGRIVDDKGLPRGGARISVFPNDGKPVLTEVSEHALVTGITDGDGKYCMFVSPGSYVLCVENDLMNTVKVEVANETVKSDIIWRGVFRARVEVLGEDGPPIGRCRVLFAPYGTTESDLEALIGETIIGPACGRGITNDRGSCEVVVPPNIYTIRIAPPPHGSYQAKLIKQVSISGDWTRTIKLSPKEPVPESDG